MACFCFSASKRTKINYTSSKAFTIGTATKVPASSSGTTRYFTVPQDCYAYITVHPSSSWSEIDVYVNNCQVMHFTGACHSEGFLAYKGDIIKVTSYNGGSISGNYPQYAITGYPLE